MMQGPSASSTLLHLPLSCLFSFPILCFFVCLHIFSSSFPSVPAFYYTHHCFSLISPPVWADGF